MFIHACFNSCLGLWELLGTLGGGSFRTVFLLGILTVSVLMLNNSPIWLTLVCVI